jgi:ankyrin repeat protein
MALSASPADGNPVPLLRIADVLTARGANPNARDFSGRSVLCYAVPRHETLALFLLEHGATVDTTTPIAIDGPPGATLLHQAVYSPRLCEALIDRGAEVNARDAVGAVPIDYAIAHARSESITLLLKRGADPNARDNQGNTILHRMMWHLRIGPSDEATPEEWSACVTALADGGADLQARNIFYDTPLDLAEWSPRNFQRRATRPYTYAEQPKLIKAANAARPPSLVAVAETLKRYLKDRVPPK